MTYLLFSLFIGTGWASQTAPPSPLQMDCQLQALTGYREPKIEILPQDATLPRPLPRDGSSVTFDGYSPVGLHYNVRIQRNRIVGMLVEAIVPQTKTSPSLSNGESFYLAYDPEKKSGALVYQNTAFKEPSPPQFSFFAQHPQYVANFILDQNDYVQIPQHSPPESEIAFENIETRIPFPKFYVDMYDRPISKDKSQGATRFRGHLAAVKGAIAALSTDVNPRTAEEPEGKQLRLVCRFL